MREWLARIAAVGRRGRRDRELDDELQFHLERLAADHERRGLTPPQAREAAERDLGGLGRTRQAWRDQRTWLPLEELLQDTRYGWRVLRRSPSVTLLAMLTLALAVAATTSVFSVIDAVLLAPMPYPHADRLAVLWEYYVPMHAPGVSVAPGNFLEWHDRARAFAAMTAIESRQQNLTRDGEPLQVMAAAVSADFAATARVSPAIGRMFDAGAFAPGHDDQVLLGHALWLSRYGGDSAVVGKAITLDDRPYTVVGVMPPGFLFPDPGFDLWVPLPLTAADRENRTGHQWVAVGRLRDGVSLAAATRELHDVADVLRRAYPASNRDWDVNLQSARDALVGDTRPVLLAVMGAVALLLLVACANVAGLLLTRGLARSRELAIRTAVGASRQRLVRQLLTESVLLALAAGGLGIALARAAQPVVAALRPADLVVWKPIALDARALAFALGAALLSGGLFGTLPALAASRAGLESSASARSAGKTASRTRQALIAFEVALALVLVVGAALLGETLARLTSTDPGFVADGVVTMTISLPQGRYPTNQATDAFDAAVFERIRALPGVRAAGATHALPLSGASSVRFYQIDGQPPSADRPVANYRIVTPGYLEAMRIPLRAGRAFDSRDTTGRPLVALVNETLAHQAWGRRSPIGSRITFGGTTNLWAEVVGVVGDVRHFGPGTPPTAEMYWPAAQVGAVPGETLGMLHRNMTLVVRADGDPAALVPAIRVAVRGVDAEQPIADVQTMTARLGASLALARGSAWLLTIFGGAAVSFALLGVFGAASYAVAQRRRELAVRMALGAAPGTVTWLMVRSALGGALAGIALGIGLALALGTSVSSLLIGVRAADPATFAGASIGIAVAVLVACWLPARRAARIDPMGALRIE